MENVSERAPDIGDIRLQRCVALRDDYFCLALTQLGMQIASTKSAQ